MKVCILCKCYTNDSTIERCSICNKILESCTYNSDSADKFDYSLICACGKKPKLITNVYYCSCGRSYSTNGYLLSTEIPKNLNNNSVKSVIFIWLSFILGISTFIFSVIKSGEFLFPLILGIAVFFGVMYLGFSKEERKEINEGAKLINKRKRAEEEACKSIDESYNSNKSQTPQIITCPACQGKVSSQAKSCPHCGQPINTQITCPKCGSTDVDNIGGFNKGASALAFGVFAANTVLNNYKCKKCGLKFK